MQIPLALLHSILTAFLFGITPAPRATRMDAAQAMKSLGTRLTASRSGLRPAKRSLTFKLGARRLDVTQMVMHEGMWFGLLGVCAGVPAAIAVARLASSRIADDRTAQRYGASRLIDWGVLTLSCTSCTRVGG